MEKKNEKTYNFAQIQRKILHSYTKMIVKLFSTEWMREFWCVVKKIFTFVSFSLIEFTTPDFLKNWKNL